jgi:hypothetical protein
LLESGVEKSECLDFFNPGGRLERVVALSFQPFPDPQRIPATIQYGMHTNHIPFHTVVDGKREALGETTAMTVYGLMNSGVHEKGVNV